MFQVGKLTSVEKDTVANRTNLIANMDLILVLNMIHQTVTKWTLPGGDLVKLVSNPWIACIQDGF